MTRPLSSLPASAPPACHIINLQPALGGAEVYTMFFARAIAQTGCATSLYIRRGVRLWDHLPQHQIRLVEVEQDTDIPGHLEGRSWLVTHAPVTEAFVQAVRGKHRLTGFCHMPLAGRKAGVLVQYDLVYGVSRYVLSTLGPAGIKTIYPEPMYGVAEFERGETGEALEPLMRGITTQWDQRKIRDRLLSHIAPSLMAMRPSRQFERLQGTTLGIVSNIGPIKQFDRLFGIIAPIMARRAEVRLEVFGNGGYRSVTDFRRSLGPMRERTRFWGQQSAPQRIYPNLDYLLSGLPEKEALGLNIIEAQLSNTPVLAVNAQPFTETVLDNVTGLLYPDPRSDGGAGFERVLARAIDGPPLKPTSTPAGQSHLQRFSMVEFGERVGRLVEHAREQFLRSDSPSDAALTRLVEANG